jgi:hypothetical protein
LFEHALAPVARLPEAQAKGSTLDRPIAAAATICFEA